MTEDEPFSQDATPPPEQEVATPPPLPAPGDAPSDPPGADAFPFFPRMLRDRRHRLLTTPKPLFEVPGRIALAALLFVALFDYLLYRGSGALGYAVLFLLAAPLLCLAHWPVATKGVILPACLLLLLAAKTLWQYDSFTPWLGFFLLATLGFSLSGLPGCLLDRMKSGLASLFHSLQAEAAFLRAAARLPATRFLRALVDWPVLAPLFVLALFLTVFGLANPIVSAWISDAADWIAQQFGRIVDWLPTWCQIAFWIFSGLVVSVWLCPVRTEAKALKEWLGPGETLPEAQHLGPEVDRRARVAWNTLVAVNLLFAVYNGVDANYLWVRRELPEGISYSEYAIDGATWLTVALALTSLVLGVIFSGRLNFHARTPRLSFLAWIWTAQNLLLASFAGQRLLMYIGFNGLTRWRIVGALGIALVVIGLLIVARKVRARKTFLWMVRRQLTALAIGLCILLLSPMDYLAHTVNARLILSGEPGPAYQVVSQPKSAEALPPLLPLLEAEDAAIREGTASVLLEELARLRQYDQVHTRWSYTELSRRWALRRLSEAEPRLRALVPPEARRQSIHRLEDHTRAYKWPGRPSRQSR